jgi:hypothetical protein
MFSGLWTFSLRRYKQVSVSGDRLPKIPQVSGDRLPKIPQVSGEKMPNTTSGDPGSS